jgi:hypothetical protein
VEGDRDVEDAGTVRFGRGDETHRARVAHDHGAVTRDVLVLGNKTAFLGPVFDLGEFLVHRLAGLLAVVLAHRPEAVSVHLAVGEPERLMVRVVGVLARDDLERILPRHRHLAGTQDRVEEGEIPFLALGDVVGEEFAVDLDAEPVVHFGEFHGRFGRSDGAEQGAQAEGEEKGAMRHVYNAWQTEPVSETLRLSAFTPAGWRRDVTPSPMFPGGRPCIRSYASMATSHFPVIT